MQRFGHIFLKILKNETPNNVPPFVPVPCSWPVPTVNTHLHWSHNVPGETTNKHARQLFQFVLLFWLEGSLVGQSGGLCLGGVFIYIEQT